MKDVKIPEVLTRKRHIIPQCCKLDVFPLYQVFGSYVITSQTLTEAKEKMVVMHPLPRVNEIRSVRCSSNKDESFRQSKSTKLWSFQ